MNSVHRRDTSASATHGSATDSQSWLYSWIHGSATTTVTAAEVTATARDRVRAPAAFVSVHHCACRLSERSGELTREGVNATFYLNIRAIGHSMYTSAIKLIFRCSCEGTLHPDEQLYVAHYICPVH